MGKAPCCEKHGVRRGAWTPEEDEALVDYITKHGHGSWRALPKHAGATKFLSSLLMLFLYGTLCFLSWSFWKFLKLGKSRAYGKSKVVYFFYLTTAVSNFFSMVLNIN